MASHKPHKVAKATSPPRHKKTLGQTSELSTEYVDNSDDASGDTDQAESPDEAPQKRVRSDSDAKHIETSTDTIASTDNPQDDSQDTSATDSTTSDSDAESSSEEAREEGHAKKSTGSSKSKGKQKDVSTRHNDQSSSRIRSQSNGVIAPEFKFIPPEGFEKSKNPGRGKGASELRSRSSNKRQKLWYISAPSDLPINSIREAFVQRARSNENSEMSIDPEKVVGSHGDAEYTIVEDESSSLPSRIYIPHEKNSNYELTKWRTSKVLHLRQKLWIPPQLSKSGSIAAAQPAVAAPRPPPIQPSGLKIRYQPFGIAEGNSDTRALPALRRGNTKAEEKPRKGKRKADKAAEVKDDIEESPKKKHRKRKKNPGDALQEAA